MSSTFTIDETQVKTVAKKIMFRLIKIMAIILLIIILQGLLTRTDPLFPTLMAMCIVIAVVVIILFRLNSRVTHSVKEFKLTIDESGIESKAPMTVYKKIYWENVNFTEKKNGVIVIYNKSATKINRWWAGGGVIVVPYEIGDREQLIDELNKHMNSLV